VRKTDEDRHQHDQRHARKEHVIETAAGQVRSASTRPGVFRSCGHSSPSAVPGLPGPEGVTAIVGSMTRSRNVGTGYRSKHYNGWQNRD
jgi:hypothetical protein